MSSQGRLESSGTSFSRKRMRRPLPVWWLRWNYVTGCLAPDCAAEDGPEDLLPKLLWRALPGRFGRHLIELGQEVVKLSAGKRQVEFDAHLPGRQVQAHTAR